MGKQPEAEAIPGDAGEGPDVATTNATPPPPLGNTGIALRARASELLTHGLAIRSIVLTASLYNIQASDSYTSFTNHTTK